MYIVSWFVTMRVADWTKWKLITAIAARKLNMLIRGIHPAAVKCPVSASVVGRSSHVKLSVRSIARSILRCRSLKQRNQITIESSINLRTQSKNTEEALISCC
jgi:hypothetical protein